MLCSNFKWRTLQIQVSRYSGILFPHLYDVLNVADVVRVDDMRLDENGVYILPEDLKV